jgi:hypothetical protein
LRTPTANGQRNENLLGACFDDVQDNVTLIGRGRNIKKRDFVGALLVVAAGNLDRITGITQTDKVGPLDDTASRDVKTGNNTLGEH